MNITQASITAIRTKDNKTITAEQYILATGADAPLHTKPLGIHLPIYPMKGYSVTVPVSDASNAPQFSITDQEQKIVCTRLGDKFRIAGTVEFAGYDKTIHQKRINALIHAARILFPNAGEYEQGSPWACLRPATPDGQPIIGKTKYSNFFLNVGHGSLGWVLAAGSAFKLADIIEGKQPKV